MKIGKPFLQHFQAQYCKSAKFLEDGEDYQRVRACVGNAVSLVHCFNCCIVLRPSVWGVVRDGVLTDNPIRGLPPPLTHNSAMHQVEDLLSH